MHRRIHDLLIPVVSVADKPLQSTFETKPHNLPQLTAAESKHKLMYSAKHLKSNNIDMFGFTSHSPAKKSL